MKKITLKLFQFTPPRRGRQFQNAEYAGSNDFNSRPRVGGDDVCISEVQESAISIHAPA